MHQNRTSCMVADQSRIEKRMGQDLRSALAFEGKNNVKGSDGLALGVLGVSDRIADDALKEDFEHAAGLLVDQT